MAQYTYNKLCSFHPPHFLNVWLRRSFIENQVNRVRTISNSSPVCNSVCSSESLSTTITRHPGYSATWPINLSPERNGSWGITTLHPAVSELWHQPYPASQKPPHPSDFMALRPSSKVRSYLLVLSGKQGALL